MGLLLLVLYVVGFCWSFDVVVLMLEWGKVVWATFLVLCVVGLYG